MTRPEGGGVLRSYTSCESSPATLVKTMVNNFYVEEIVGVHNQVYRYAAAQAYKTQTS